MALTIADLTEIARQFLRDEYGMALEIPVKRNNRLRTSMGRFVETYDEDLGEHTPNRIELSGITLEYGADTAIIDVLKHELVHYALCVKDEPNDDGHPHFEAELRRLGISSTETTTIGPAVVYQCSKCKKRDYTGNKRVVRDLESGGNGYRTRCCKASLTYIKTIICNGTQDVDEVLSEVRAVG